MKRQCRLSARAKTQVEDIYNYTKAKFGIEQADKYVSGLIAEIESRGENPVLATRLDSNLAARFNVPEIRSFLYKRVHRCYFIYDERIVLILAVYHGARNPAKIEELLKQALGEIERDETL